MRRAHCQRCDRHRSECGPISWSGLCTACAVNAVVTNVEGMGTMRKQERERWRRGMAASVGAVLVEDVAR